MRLSSKRAHKLDPVALRSSFEKDMRMVKPPPGTIIEPVNVDGVPCEWLTHGSRNSKPVILYLHGGAYVFGSINTHRAFAASLAAKSQASALIVGFRLAPESPFPAAFDDTLKCYRWLLNRGTAPGDIILAGDSSGAGLALSLLVSLRDAGEPLPAAAVLISPWTDLTGSGESQTTFERTDPMCKSAKLMEWAMMYAGSKAALTHPLISPLFADLTGLPPLRIYVSSNEVLYSDAERLAAKAKHAGVSCDLIVGEDMLHVWPLFETLIPEGRQATTDIGAFIRDISKRTLTK